MWKKTDFSIVQRHCTFKTSLYIYVKHMADKILLIKKGRFSQKKTNRKLATITGLTINLRHVKL